MNRINRRRFVAVTSVAATSAVLVACGNNPLSEEELNPTQNPDVPGAPPTLAPITSTPGADSGSGDSGGDTGGGAAAITIEAHDDFTFSPADVEVAPGQTVTLTNAGFMQHDLVCPDLGVETALLDGGASEDIVIPEDAAVGETFDFHCSVPGHEQSGMVGTFTIVEAGAAAPADEGEETEGEGTDEGAAAGGGEAITIEAHDDFTFSPADVEVAPGQTVTVNNAGFMQHDLVCPDLGVQTDMLNGGDSQDIVIPEDAAVGETFDFHCSVPGHEQSGMVGTFTIVEASAAAAPAGDGEETEEATAEGEVTTDEGAATGGGGEAVTIEANDDFSFTPAEVEVAPGQTVTVTNAGFMQHDLVSDDLGVGTEMLNGGDSQDIVIPEDAAVGESFKFICTVAGHEQSGMTGTFTIVEGSAAAAPAGDDEETEEATAAAAEGEASPAAVEAPSDNTPMASTVIGTKFQFTPAELEMAPGGVLTWQNDTDMQMGLSSEAWDDGSIPFIRSISSGKTAEFTIPADAEVGSEIEFKSNLTEAVNQGMVGKITIVEGDGTAAASPAASPSAEASPAAGGSSAGIEVDMLDTLKYEPAEIEASVGDTIHFVNSGYMQHDAKVDDWGDEPITPMLNNGESHDFVIPDSAEVGQEYEFYCTVPGHQQAGMVGKITIV